jgi:hypothetical protein
VEEMGMKMDMKIMYSACGWAIETEGEKER